MTAIRRDPTTWSVFAGLGLVGFVLNGLGPVLPHLQDDLGLSRVEVSNFPSLYAAGLLIVGLGGGRVITRIGRGAVFKASAVGMGASAVLLAVAPSRAIAVLAAGLLGVGAAFNMSIVNAVLPDIHGDKAVVAITQANALSSFSAISAPLLIGATLAAGWGWQLGFAMLPAAAGLSLLFVHVDMAAPAVARVTIVDQPKMARQWVTMVVVISIEFAFVFWTTDFLQNVAGFGEAKAAGMTAAFFVGMAAARGFAGRLTPWLINLRRASVQSLMVSLIGFGLFWSLRSPPGAVLGLFVAGAGVANLYPLSYSSLAARYEGRSDRGAIVGTLASGVAISASPLLLGGVADVTGLATAMALVIPGLIITALVLVTRR